MIIDKQNTLASAQAVTASAASADYIDLGAARDISVSDHGAFLVTVDEAATAAGAATVNFQLQCDDNSSFSSAKTVFDSGAIGKATLVPGYQFFIKIPYGLDERYVRANFVVATGPLTAGKFTVQYVHGVQMNKHYPDGIA